MSVWKGYLQLQRSIPTFPAILLLEKEDLFLLALQKYHHKHLHIKAIWLLLHIPFPVFWSRYTMEKDVFCFHFSESSPILNFATVYSVPTDASGICQKGYWSWNSQKRSWYFSRYVRITSSLKYPFSHKALHLFSGLCGAYRLHYSAHFHPFLKRPCAILPEANAKQPYPVLVYPRINPCTHAHVSLPLEEKPFLLNSHLLIPVSTLLLIN